MDQAIIGKPPQCGIFAREEGKQTKSSKLEDTRQTQCVLPMLSESNRHKNILDNEIEYEKQLCLKIEENKYYSAERARERERTNMCRAH